MNAQARIHALVDRMAAAALQHIRLTAAAHRAALDGKSFNRSLAQRVRYAKGKA